MNNIIIIERKKLTSLLILVSIIVYNKYDEPALKKHATAGVNPGWQEPQINARRCYQGCSGMRSQYPSPCTHCRALEAI